MEKQVKARIDRSMSLSKLNNGLDSGLSAYAKLGADDTNDNEDDSDDLIVDLSVYFQDILKVGSLDYDLEELNLDLIRETLNFRHTIPLLAVKDFERYPNQCRTGAMRLFSLIQHLKTYGEVRFINFVADQFGPNYLNFKIIHPDGDPRKNIYFSLNETSELDADKYPEYKDDIFKEHIVYVDFVLFHIDSDNTAGFKLFDEVNKKCKIDFSSDETYIEMIIQTQNGLTTQRVRFDSEYGNDLDLHYGEGFSLFHEKLLDRIGSRDKGIVMFHGPPGNGKTHYIRRLLPSLNKGGKRVILIPKHILESLESPGFNHFMIQNFVGQKIIFVMEDAESIIAKRTVDGGGRSQLVSTLLNITDGILNDIFSIQVILTFNTDLKSIDEALLRKGRLIAKYEFQSIGYSQAKKLAEYIGVELNKVQEEYTLAEIYALRESEEDDLLINQNLEKKKEALGF